MKRRQFLGLAGAAAVIPRVALAQQAAKVPRIALVLNAGLLPEFVQGYIQGLADYGYVDGKTIVLETFTVPTLNDASAVFARVVATKPDIIVANSNDLAVAAHSATATIPIVFGAVSDPVALGLVASLAHPGGNVTGVSSGSPDVVGKQLQIVKETIPTINRLVALSQSAAANNALMIPQVLVAAKALNIETIVVDFVDGPDFIAQFDRVVAAAPQAVYVPASVYFSTNRDLLQDLQIKYRLPLFAPNPTVYLKAMVAYGPSPSATIRRAGAYVDAILRGAKPQDLAVEFPTVWDFGINLSTAKAIGVTIPPSILAHATRVIE